MENDLIVEKSWFYSNWKWLLSAIIFFIALGIVFTATSIQNITDLTQAYSDKLLYEKAVEKANLNPEVNAKIGIIEPIDNLAILEGNVVYSNNKNTVESTVRFKGSKENGKIDILAHKKATKWVYEKITIRLKKQKVVIEIL